MARARKNNASSIETKQVREPKHDAAKYAAQYRSDHPLLQGRVPARLYREAQRRAAAVDFSLSKWLGYWLDLTFRQNKLKAGS